MSSEEPRGEDNRPKRASPMCTCMRIISLASAALESHKRPVARPRSHTIKAKPPRLLNLVAYCPRSVQLDPTTAAPSLLAG